MTSCGSYVEYGRTYCADSSKYLLRYDHDMGALDGGRSWSIAILNSTDSAKELCNKYSIINNKFDNIYWKGNDTVIVEENYLEFMREGKTNFKDSIFEINKIPVKVIHKDPLDSSYPQKILYKKTSPNNKYDLVVYRYLKAEHSNSTIHISVVNKNESIPKYGNFYITKDYFNCFEDIRWDSLSNLKIKVSEACTSGYENSFVSKKLDVRYKIEIIKIGAEDKTNDNIKEE